MISNAEYQMMLARTARVIPADTAGQHTGLESELHDQIAEYCQGRGWIVIHSRTDRPSTVAVGTADFVILADKGIAYVVECKRKGSKMTPQQVGFLVWAEKLGHPSRCCYSFAEFLDFVNQ